MKIIENNRKGLMALFLSKKKKIRFSNEKTTKIINIKKQARKKPVYL